MTQAGVAYRLDAITKAVITNTRQCQAAIASGTDRDHGPPSLAACPYPCHARDRLHMRPDGCAPSPSPAIRGHDACPAFVARGPVCRDHGRVQRKKPTRRHRPDEEGAAAAEGCPRLGLALW